MKRSPKDTEISARRIGRRGLILGGAQLGVMGILAARMRFMQVEQADQFRLLAEENRINIRLLPPSRGLIFDRNGIAIADNEQNYRIVIVKEDAGDVDEILARLSRLVALAPEDLERARREIDRRSPFVPVTIADRLSWEDIAEVAVNAPALPGVTPEVGLSRRYPLDDDFAHIVGYVGPVSDYDLDRLEDPDPLLQIPRFQIGKVGVEAKLEHELRGKAGNRRIEVNAVGRVMRELDRNEGQPGADIQLTVDAGLQNYAQARLAEDSASAVVMDTVTGDILAIASAPSFDPNKFVRGISVADYGALTGNPYRPLANKTVQGVYPPGSTFKMVTALAALEAGVIRPDETVWCPGHKEVGGRRFHCWKRAGHGWLSLLDSLSQSCDVYYYEVAERVGIENIAAMARKLGLGLRHDLPMSAVADGLTPNKAWKRENRGAEWVVGDTLNSGIGQGFVLTSPLQLAVMTARIASGRDVVPRLVKSIDSVEQPARDAATLDIDPEHLRLVRRGMYQVNNHRRGTAYGSRIAADGMRMAGKTGTSQVRNITVAERARGVFRNQDLPWNRRDHALFVSFAPYDAPRIACSVVVEHGGGGSAVAAPIARDIVLQALYGELPPLSAYPRSQRGTIETRQREIELRDLSIPGDGRSRMSYLEYTVKHVPSGPRKVLYLNWALILLLVAVSGIGFLMLYSVAGGTLAPWAEPQMKRFVLGIALMFAVAMVPIWFWRNLAGLAYGISILLLLFVELFGVTGMGAQRWIDLGFMRLQPSELTKITLVMILAAYYDWLDIKKTSRPLWVLIPVLIILLPTLLVLRQPDLGTAVLLLAGGSIMMFLAGVHWAYFGAVFALAGGLVAAVLESRGTAWQMLKDYQYRRIDTFLNPETDPLGSGYHITQSKIALGSGGWTGRGFMQGTQSRLNFLPEKHTDFIFTTLAEEFGFLGGISLLTLYGLIILFCIASGLANKDRFGALMTFGVAATFFMFFAVNMSMVMGLAPVVGVPLPLVSYGGSAMLVLLLGFGLVQSAHVHRPRNRR